MSRRGRSTGTAPSPETPAPAATWPPWGRPGPGQTGVPAPWPRNPLSGHAPKPQYPVDKTSIPGRGRTPRYLLTLRAGLRVERRRDSLSCPIAQGRRRGRNVSGRVSGSRSTTYLRTPAPTSTGPALTGGIAVARGRPTDRPGLGLRAGHVDRRWGRAMDRGELEVARPQAAKPRRTRALH